MAPPPFRSRIVNSSRIIALKRIPSPRIQDSVVQALLSTRDPSLGVFYMLASQFYDDLRRDLARGANGSLTQHSVLALKLDGRKYLLIESK